MKIDIHIAKNGELVHIGYIENEVFDTQRRWSYATGDIGKRSS